MKRILVFLLMLASIFSLVACRMGGDKPNSDKPNTNNNDNGINDMPAITGERIEIEFNKEGYTLDDDISVTVKLHIPEKNFFSNVDHYEVILVKGVYDALMYPEKDYQVLATIQKADKDKYTNLMDIGNMKYYDISKTITIPTDSIKENNGKFTIALVGLKANDNKSIISSAYHNYTYIINENKVSITK